MHAGGPAERPLQAPGKPSKSKQNEKDQLHETWMNYQQARTAYFESLRKYKQTHPNENNPISGLPAQDEKILPFNQGLLHKPQDLNVNRNSNPNTNQMMDPNHSFPFLHPQNHSQHQSQPQSGPNTMEFPVRALNARDMHYHPYRRTSRLLPARRQEPMDRKVDVVSFAATATRARVLPGLGNWKLGDDAIAAAAMPMSRFGANGSKTGATSSSGQAFRHTPSGSNFGMKIESGVSNALKSFKCQYCPKSFKVKNSLRRHERMHTGENLVLCEYCGKHFCDMATLETHVRMHTGEKPYQCQVCGRTFSQKGNLNRHIRRQHVMKKHQGSGQAVQPNVALRAAPSQTTAGSHGLVGTAMAISSLTGNIGANINMISKPIAVGIGMDSSPAMTAGVAALESVATRQLHHLAHHTRVAAAASAPNAPNPGPQAQTGFVDTLVQPGQVQEEQEASELEAIGMGKEEES